ncbi:hypothetical protein HanIR_Chr13g0665731 [Helianthus annuus]|nr:hypothetical protein HanIR_Chr13g0665731 [Helianthus annuus]
MFLAIFLISFLAPEFQTPIFPNSSFVHHGMLDDVRRYQHLRRVLFHVGFLVHSICFAYGIFLSVF